MNILEAFIDVPIVTEPFSALDRTLIISVKYRLLCKDVHQSSVGSKNGCGEVHSEPHPPKQKSCMKPHTIHHKVAII